MTTVSHPPRKGYRTIRLPLSELEYDRFIEDRTYAKCSHFKNSAMVFGFDLLLKWEAC
jgi:hypothetical protein